MTYRITKQKYMEWNDHKYDWDLWTCIVEESEIDKDIIDTFLYLPPAIICVLIGLAAFSSMPGDIWITIIVLSIPIYIIYALLVIFISHKINYNKIKWVSHGKFKTKAIAERYIRGLEDEITKK